MPKKSGTAVSEKAEGRELKPEYADVEDENLCRRLTITTTVDLGELKKKIHKCFSKDYDLAFNPSDITLYTRNDPRDMEREVRISSQKQLASALSYPWPWSELQGTDSKNVLLVVSRHRDDTLRHILIVPVNQPAALSSLEQACSDPATDSSRLLEFLRGALPYFPPVPVPVHIDDWLAQYREQPQHVSDLLSSKCARPTPTQHVIYVVPIGVSEECGAAAPLPSLDIIIEYIRAFFDDQVQVKTLPEKILTRKPGSRQAKVEGFDVMWRDKVPSNGHAEPQGQYLAPNILKCLERQIKLRKMPQDAFCVLGLTMADLFITDSDTFTVGLASLSDRAGVFSFWRYQDAHAADTQNLLLSRACKTAVHELLHIYGIGHCVHFTCLMNGSGHLREDFAIPHHLCPVCTAKLCAVVPAIDPVRRLQRLVDLFRARPGFMSEAGWVAQLVDGLSGGKRSSEHDDGDEHAQTEKTNGRARKPRAKAAKK